MKLTIEIPEESSTGPFKTAKAANAVQDLILDLQAEIGGFDATPSYRKAMQEDIALLRRIKGR